MNTLRTKARVLVHAYNNQHQIAEGYLMCLQNSPLQDEDMKRDLAFAIEAIRKAKRITQCLSEITYCEEVANTVSGLLDLLDGLADRLQIKHKTSIGAEFEPQFILLKGDSNLVYAAIASLVENGIEACGDSDEVSICSSLLKAEEFIEEEHCYIEPGTYLKICVTDKGRGMTQQLLSESRELLCSTKSNTHGVGVGVPLAQSVTERYGGALVMQSEEEVGTTATMLFPLV